MIVSMVRVKMPKVFFVYILRCKDGTFYCGSTNDLERRVHRHNSAKSGAHYTKIRRPVTLVYSKKFKTYAEARKREGEIKRLTRKEKLEFVDNNCNIKIWKITEVSGSLCQKNL